MSMCSRRTSKDEEPSGPDPVTVELHTPILLGQSGAQVVHVRHVDGSSWIEKSGHAREISKEASVLRWCAGRLPVAAILQESPGLIRMSVLPGVPLSQVSMDLASRLLSEALHRIHSVSPAACPFTAAWDLRLLEADQRLRAGLIDEADFDQANQGRSALELLDELRGCPSLPNRSCFTHGDASLENFLTHEGKLSGIVDLGRAGITHPAQDWALALRDMRDQFGLEGEQNFRCHIPPDCSEESLLRRFCLLDELF